VLRGGSILFTEKEIRASYRYYLAPDYRYYSIGFRCASTAPSP